MGSASVYLLYNVVQTMRINAADRAEREGAASDESGRDRAAGTTATTMAPRGDGPLEKDRELAVYFAVQSALNSLSSILIPVAASAAALVHRGLSGRHLVRAQTFLDGAIPPRQGMDPRWHLDLQPLLESSSSAGLKPSRGHLPLVWDAGGRAQHHGHSAIWHTPVPDLFHAACPLRQEQVRRMFSKREEQEGSAPRSSPFKGLGLILPLCLTLVIRQGMPGCPDRGFGAPAPATAIELVGGDIAWGHCSLPGGHGLGIILGIGSEDFRVSCGSSSCASVAVGSEQGES